MVIVYRLCPEGNPLKKRPIWPKMDLVTTCFKSVMEAFKGTQTTFHFILDKATPELIALVKSCPFQYVIEPFREPSWEIGNEVTYFRQLDIASETTDKVLLLEDDYYFLQDTGKTLINALDELDFVTPYDHPGYYTEHKHDYLKEVRLVGDYHFMKIIDTTLTFGARSGKLIKDNLAEFKSNSVWDEKIWKKLANYGLWCPIPSLATHMETDYLAPSIKWPFLS